ncbi:TPM domain-containing protein [Prosthecobacter sp.]
MRCPACRTPAIETDATCGQCGFSLETADRVFGIAPTLERPISDNSEVLGSFARKKVARVIADLERRFPQVAVAVVLTEVPQQAPLAAYAFWIFNRSQLSSAVEKGGGNHLVLLLIDTPTKRAITMVGYGLEPFVQETHLQSCLQAAEQPMQHGHLGQAIEAFTRELDRQMGELCRLIPKQFGLVDDAHWMDATEEDAGVMTTNESLY